MANSPSGESVISRVSRILESFDREHPELTITQLARRADLPLSTAQRLTNELIAVGWLDRENAGLIRPGLRFWELASRSSRLRSLREIALPFMGDLLQALQLHITLAVLDGGSVLYLERMRSSDIEPLNAKVAERMPVHASSSGLVLMAHQPFEVQEAFLAGPLPQRTDLTPTSPDALRRLLNEARTRGYLAPAGIGEPDWTGIAVPIWDPEGVPAALNVIAPSESVEIARIMPALEMAAHGVSRTLCLPPPQALAVPQDPKHTRSTGTLRPSRR